MIVRRYARATRIALPALGVLARLRPRETEAIAALLTGTIGVAHGANDDAILARLAPDVPGGRVAISAAYGVLGIATFAAALRAPLVAKRSLDAVAWVHFGSGDVAFERACGSRRGAAALETLVRGAIPLVATAATMRGRWVALAAAFYALRHALNGEGAAALDVALPVAALLVAPSPLGFAIYFAAWHSPRHLALLLERDPRGGSIRERIGRYARETAPNVGIALGASGLAFAMLRGRKPHDVFVALTLGVTVPHQAAVWYAERAATKPAIPQAPA